MSQENLVTVVIKHQVHESVISSITDFFEVTRNRARTMLVNELTRRGMTNDSVLVLGECGNSSIYELCNDMRETRDVANAYSHHRVIHLRTGELFVVRQPKGRARSQLEPLGGDNEELSPENVPTEEPPKENLSEAAQREVDADKAMSKENDKPKKNKKS